MKEVSKGSTSGSFELSARESACRGTSAGARPGATFVKPKSSISSRAIFSSTMIGAGASSVAAF